MACGALEEYWLVVAHRDEVVSEEGGYGRVVGSWRCWPQEAPYISGLRLERNFVGVAMVDGEPFTVLTKERPDLAMI